MALHASLHPAEGSLRGHHRAGRLRNGGLLVGGGRTHDLGDDVLTVLPGTLPPKVLIERLARDRRRSRS